MMFSRIIGVACCVTALLSAAAQTDKPRIPETADAPLIDGILEDSCWKTATGFSEMSALNNVATKNGETIIKLCRDKKWLYIAARCGNAKMEQAAQTAFVSDNLVCVDDSVEIFIAPGPGDKIYYHFMLNFANVRYSCALINGVRNASWRSPWRTATKRAADGWSAEIAVPLYALDGGDLAEAKLNICRNKANVEVDAAGAKVRENRKQYTLAKLKQSFHEPEHFLPVDGLGGFKPEVPFAPEIEAVEIGGYQGSKGDYVYSVTVTAFSSTPTAGTADVAVVETIPGKAPREFVGHLARGKSAVTVNVPTDSLAERALKVVLRAPDTGEQLAVRDTVDVSALESMKKIIADRSCYTSEKNVRLRAGFGLSKELLKNATLNISTDGVTLVDIKDLQSQMVIAIPLKRLKHGDNALLAELRENGKTLATRQISVTRLAPNPAGEVKIDNFNRILLKNDTPIFPFGVYLTPNITDTGESVFSFLKEVGFDTVVRTGTYANVDVSDYYRGNVNNAEAFLKTAEKYGFNVINWGQSLTPPLIPDKTLDERLKIQSGRYSALEPDIIRETEILKRSPNFLMYYNVDEPNLENRDERVAVVEWYYKTVTRRDPYHPVFILYAQNIPAGDNWTKWGQVLAFDVYTYPDWGSSYCEPGEVMAWYTSRLNRRAEQQGKVMFMVPSLGALDPARNPIPITTQQQLCQSYIAMIYGAKGLLYFTAFVGLAPERWEAYRILAPQVKTLAPALLNAAVGQKIAYSPGKFDPSAWTFPPINATVFQYPNGDYIMLAANIKPFAVKTKIAVDGLTGVTRMFGDSERFELAGNGFMDKFEPYGVRAYRLETRGVTEPVKVSITMENILAEKAPLVPIRKIIEKLRAAKNLIPNPTFARRKVKGLPDFIRPYNTYDMDVPREGSCWFLDETNPWNGKASIQMRDERVDDDFKTKKVPGSIGVCYPLNSDKTEDYVFSFYAKGAKDGDSIWLYLWNLENKKYNFKLTKDWKRYSAKCRVAPGYVDFVSGGRLFCLMTGDDSTIWFSGLQLEKGDVPTDFVDDGELEEINVPRDQDNLIKNGHAEYGDTRFWELVDHDYWPTGITLAARSGKYAFRALRSQTPISELFSVDTSKPCTLSGWFKANGGSQELLFGLLPFDKEKRPIQSCNILAIEGSATVLAAPCAANDRVLKVADASGWRSGKNYQAALGDDMPNFNMTPPARNVIKNDEVWEIILDGPCGMTFPAGTKVTAHIRGGNGMYAAACWSPMPESWTQFSGTIKGVSTINARDQWWPGTAYAKVIVQRRGQGELLFDDIFVK